VKSGDLGVKNPFTFNDLSRPKCPLLRIKKT